MATGYRSLSMAVAAVLCSATFATAAPAYEGAHGTFATSDYGGNSVVMISRYESAFDMRFLNAMPNGYLVGDRLDHRAFPGHRALASKPRPAGAAIMATSQAGVMSGRLRRLSG